MADGTGKGKVVLCLTNYDTMKMYPTFD